MSVAYATGGGLSAFRGRGVRRIPTVAREARAHGQRVMAFRSRMVEQKERTATVPSLA